MRVVAAVVLVMLSAWLLFANPVPGGAILVSVSAQKGLDLVDLALLPLLMLAAWFVWPRAHPARAPVPPGPTPALVSGPPVNVLIVCSANQCRSPIAAELLERSLQAFGVPAVVRSAGTSVESGLPALDEARAAIGGLASHRTVPLTEPLVERADLVLGMTRHHVREAVLLCPDAFERAFTVLELVRRGHVVGPRPTEEPIRRWLSHAGAGRRPADLAGTSEAEEIPDPVGQGPESVATTATELGVALDEIVALVWGPRPQNGRGSAVSGPRR